MEMLAQYPNARHKAHRAMYKRVHQHRCPICTLYPPCDHVDTQLEASTLRMKQVEKGLRPAKGFSEMYSASAGELIAMMKQSEEKYEKRQERHRLDNLRTGRVATAATRGAQESTNKKQHQIKLEKEQHWVTTGVGPAMRDGGEGTHPMGA